MWLAGAGVGVGLSMGWAEAASAPARPPARPPGSSHATALELQLYLVWARNVLVGLAWSGFGMAWLKASRLVVTRSPF